MITIRQRLLNIVSKWKKKEGSRFANSPVAKPIFANNRANAVFLNDLARKYEGKLLIRNEIMLDAAIFEKLLADASFTPIPSIRKNFFFFACQRCNNRKKSLFARFPCSRCGNSHYYCRNCLAMGRVMACEPLYYWSGTEYEWPKHSEPCSWKGRLTKAQQHAALEIDETIANGGELLVWAVAGAGKTEMLFPGITTALKDGKRLCIATPRADVVRELLPRLNEAFHPLHIQGLYSGSRDNDGTSQFIIATTHQLLRYRRAFDVLIIDEIDAFPYHHDETLQFAAKRAAKENASLIYLTATPREMHQSLIASKKLKHVFVPLRFHGHALPVPRLERSFSFKNGQLAPNFIAWLKERKNPSRQLLLFVPTIRTANETIAPLTELFLSEKIIAYPSELTAVHAEDKKREEKIKKFRNQNIYALVTTTILERGVTFPSVDVAVLHADHHVFDEAALVQIAGRAGRSPTDPDGEVVYFHEGKTNAIARATKAIMKMNERAASFAEKGEML